MVKILNAGLRLISLFSKFLLYGYLAKYLSLSDLGTFGLIAAFISISTSIFGFRFEYIVNREIVNCDPFRVSVLIRDQIILYTISYLFYFILLIPIKNLCLKEISWEIFMLVMGIALLESVGIVAWTNLIFLQKQITANIQLFIRSASWVFPVIFLGYLSESQRTIKTVLVAWFLGASFSFAYTFLVFKNYPWKQAVKHPFKIKEKISILNKTKLLWLGGILTSCSVFLNRFVTEISLTREAVGIVSFFSSFIISIGSLLDSGIYAFARPKIISLIQKKLFAEIKMEIKNVLATTLIVCGSLCLAVASSVYCFAILTQRLEFIHNFTTLVFMLLGAWIASGSYILYIVLYAFCADNLIWKNEIVLFL